MEFTKEALNGNAKVQTDGPAVCVSSKLDGEGEYAEPLRFSPECARELAGALMGAAQAAEPEPA